VSHEARIDIAALRARYRPPVITTLFVGESPPAGGGFFYAGDNAMLAHMRSAVDAALGPEDNVLDRLVRYGWFLDDLVDTPVDQLPVADRRRACREARPALAQRIAVAQPLAIVTLLLRIEPDVEAAASLAASSAPRYAVLFPGMGQQVRFRTAMAALLPRADA
jgi:hypothetical protein